MPQPTVESSQAGSVINPGIRLIPIAGFLGAGKTTALLHLAKSFRAQGCRVGFMRRTESVDAAILNAAGEENRFQDFARSGADFINVLNSLAADCQCILAELPGDTVHDRFVVAPGDDAQITSAPLSVVVDAIQAGQVFGREAGARLSGNLQLLFEQQLAHADIIVLNKTDLVSAPALVSLSQTLQQRFPGAVVTAVSLKTGKGVEDWFRRLMTRPASLPGKLPAAPRNKSEASTALSFLNCTVRISSVRYFEGSKMLLELAGTVQSIARQEGAEITHLKMALRATDFNDLAVVNLVRSDSSCQLTRDLSEPIQSGELFLTLRSEADPEILHSIVNRALLGMMEKSPELFARMEHCEHYRPQ